MYSSHSPSMYRANRPMSSGCGNKSSLITFIRLRDFSLLELTSVAHSLSIRCKKYSTLLMISFFDRLSINSSLIVSDFIMLAHLFKDEHSRAGTLGAFTSQSAALNLLIRLIDSMRSPKNCGRIQSLSSLMSGLIDFTVFKSRASPRSRLEQ